MKTRITKMEKVKAVWNRVTEYFAVAYVWIKFIADYIGDWISAYPKTALVAMIVLAVL
jgi:Zn/Cd-binding protein ZinT